MIGVKNTIVMINSEGGETGAERRRKEGERSESVEREVKEMKWRRAEEGKHRGDGRTGGC